MPASGSRGVEIRIDRRAARGESLLHEREGALGHLVVLVTDHEIGVHARDLADALRAPQVKIAVPESLQPLAVGPLAAGRLGLQATAQMGAVLNGAIEAGLREVFHLALRVHEIEHMPAAGVLAVGRPEGEIDRELGRPDLGALHDHDVRRCVAGDVHQQREMAQALATQAAVHHPPGVGVIRITMEHLGPQRVRQAQ